MIENNIKIILASKSPRRKEILTNAKYTFDVMVSNGELDIVSKKYNDDLLYMCIDKKYKSIEDEIIKKYNEKVIVICADTVVVLDDIIIGKPKDKIDAIQILKNLSNKTHFVATGIQIVIIENRNVISIKQGIEKTKVTFRNINDKEIEEYIDRCRPYDKAGSYGIQDEGFDFVSKIDGNVDNVIGFPMTTFNNLVN